MIYYEISQFGMGDENSLSVNDNGKRPIEGDEGVEGFSKDDGIGGLSISLGAAIQ